MGIPCIFLDISFGKLALVYRTLGNLLDCGARAEKLANYIDETDAKARARAGAVGKCKVFYAPRQNGLTVRDGIKVQLDAMTNIAATPVIEPYDMEKKTVDLGVLEKCDPDLIVFDDTACLRSFLDFDGKPYEIWRNSAAVAQGRFVVSPALMHSWFGSIVFVQSLGILWLSNTIWPDDSGFDMVSEAEKFYSLFYGLRKDDVDLLVLVGDYDESGYEHER